MGNGTDLLRVKEFESLMTDTYPSPAARKKRRRPKLPGQHSCSQLPWSPRSPGDWRRPPASDAGSCRGAQPWPGPRRRSDRVDDAPRLLVRLDKGHGPCPPRRPRRCGDLGTAGNPRPHPAGGFCSTGRDSATLVCSTTPRLSISSAPARGTVDVYETIKPVLNFDPQTHVRIVVQQGRLRFRGAPVSGPLVAEPADVTLEIGPAPKPITWQLDLKQSPPRATEPTTPQASLAIGQSYESWWECR